MILHKKAIQWLFLSSLIFTNSFTFAVTGETSTTTNPVPPTVADGIKKVTGPTAAVPVTNDGANRDAARLKDFVNSGIDYIRKYGAKKAYAEFNNPKGKFRQGQLYLFVYDYKGNCLAQGFDPKMVGKNFINERDKYGTPTLKIDIELAKAGGGFFVFYWPILGTKQESIKTSYIKPIDNRTFIGSGVYKALDVASDRIDVQLEEIKAFINTGIEYFKLHGAEAAYKAFSDPNGAFRIKDQYLFVLNSKGVLLADGTYSELIGKNLYDQTDDFGTPYVQLLIQIAQNGGGAVSYYRPEPSTKKVRLKISYIKPLTADTYIGSGFYSD